MKTLALAFLMLWQGGAYAQEKGSAKEGTYQFIFQRPGQEKNVVLSPIQQADVEKLRHDTEVVYAISASNDFIKVKILPRQQISRSDFQPAARYLFKSEMPFEEVQRMRYVEMY